MSGFHARVLPHTRIIKFAVGAAGILLLPFAYYARTWQSFTAFAAVCPRLFCDFEDYYYPMGEAIFHTGLPEPGFLYSPCIAILLAIFPTLGLNTSLILWGFLQVLFVILYFLFFRRLVPSGLRIQLLFVVLVISSYPVLLNLIAGQVSVFMIVGLLGMLVFYEGGRSVSAACLVAFAVSFKFYPIIFLAPFVIRRDTRFLLLASAACGTCLLVVPGLLLGGGETQRFYGALFDSFRESDWVVVNPHSQYFPHVVLRLADAAGKDARPFLPLLRWVAFGVAATNIGLLFLVQRARLRHAGLWSFQLLFLTIPFVLKTAWPHDFVFLSFTQALLAWWLLEGKEVSRRADTNGKRSHVRAWRDQFPPARAAVTFFLLLSIFISNIVFFNLFGNFSDYGSCSFLFLADLLLLMASYVVLLPPVTIVKNP